MNNNYTKNVGEHPIQFINRICSEKVKDNTITWNMVRDICNRECHLNCSESYYRKGFNMGKFNIDKSLPYNDNVNSDSYYIEPSQDIDVEDIDDTDKIQELLMIQRIHSEEEKFKFRKERESFKRLYSDYFKLNIYKELADHVIKQLNVDKSIKDYIPQITVNNNKKDAILVISDWHFGINIENFSNCFNPDICKQRVAKLTYETIKFCTENDINHLNVVNLGDMICGRIHPTLRIESTENIIFQTIDVTKMIIDMISTFINSDIKVDYYWCLDNHSRIEPDKEKSLKDENLIYMSNELICTAFLHNPNLIIHENVFGDDIISFDCLGFKIGACHGDLDKQNKVITNLTLYTKQSYDLILSAHMHHFSAEENNSTLLVCNGSLMGTDSYASNLRLSSTPSQNLILVTSDCVMKQLNRIIL